MRSLMRSKNQSSNQLAGAGSHTTFAETGAFGSLALISAYARRCISTRRSFARGTSDSGHEPWRRSSVRKYEASLSVIHQAPRFAYRAEIKRTKSDHEARIASVPRPP